MNKRILAHVDGLFVGVAHTRQAADIKEELLANLQAKYEDLVQGGTSEEEAFQNVISGIGDIQTLLNTEQIQVVETAQGNRQRSSLLKGLSVMLYIFSVISAVFFEEVVHIETLSILSLLSICAVATGIMVYAVSISPKKYKKEDDSFVEEYKEKVTGGNKKQRLRGAVTSTMWTMIVLVYLLVSFYTMQWHITWLIFLLGSLMQNLIGYTMGDGKRQKALINSTIWTFAVIAYFIISFSTGQWGWACFVFLVAALLQQLIRLIGIWQEQ